MVRLVLRGKSVKRRGIEHREDRTLVGEVRAAALGGESVEGAPHSEELGELGVDVGDRGLRLARDRVAAVGTARVEEAASTYAFVRFPRAVKRRAWRLRTLRLTLRAVVVDRAGRRGAAARTVTLTLSRRALRSKRLTVKLYRGSGRAARLADTSTVSLRKG